jgi:hypothetical protein
LHAQLVALAQAEDWSASSVVVNLLDQAVAVRAKERRLVAELVERLDATVARRGLPARASKGRMCSPLQRTRASRPCQEASSRPSLRCHC